MGWIGIDLDGCLAQWGTKDPVTSYIHYDVTVIGKPIDTMVQRVLAMLAEGKDVRIFTARVGPATDEECLNAFEKLKGYEPSPTPQLDWNNFQRTLIETWCARVLGRILPITCVKDFHMYQLYDDRCVQVYTNTGETLEDRITTLEAGLREIARDLATPPGMGEPA